MPILTRRTLIAAAAAAAVLPVAAQAAEFVPYEPGVIQKALKQGETVFVDYGASWCSTCARQQRVKIGRAHV